MREVMNSRYVVVVLEISRLGYQSKRRWFTIGLTSFLPNSSFTTPSCPSSAASKIAVWPYLSGLLGLTYLLPRKIFTTRGHQPSVPSGLAVAHLRSSPTIASCPFLAAHDSAARRKYPSGLSGLIVRRSSNSFTTPSGPHMVAHMSGVIPRKSHPLRS